MCNWKINWYYPEPPKLSNKLTRWRSQCQTCWYPWEAVITRNTNMQYKSSSTGCSKVISKLKSLTISANQNRLLYIYIVWESQYFVQQLYTGIKYIPDIMKGRKVRKLTFWSKILKNKHNIYQMKRWNQDSSNVEFCKWIFIIKVAYFSPVFFILGTFTIFKQ